MGDQPTETRAVQIFRFEVPVDDEWHTLNFPDRVLHVAAVHRDRPGRPVPAERRTRVRAAGHRHRAADDHLISPILMATNDQGGVISMQTISRDHAEDLFCDDDGATAGPWTRVIEVAHEARRWMQGHSLILRHEDGTHWSLDYDLGLTEEQPHELPWRNSREPVELNRVYPHEVRTVEYRTKPPA